MINIISRAINAPECGAMHKVAVNLTESLRACGVDFVVNRDLEFCSKIIILDDYRALASLKRLKGKRKILVGPNIFVLPKDIPRSIAFPRDVIFLQPSDIVKEQWSQLGFSSDKMDVWPVSINDSYFPARKGKPTDVILYHKGRDRPENRISNLVEDLLVTKKIKYNRIDYGLYNQSDYLDSLRDAKYVVWIGCKETQGLALQEAMAMGCPILVVEPRNLGDDDKSGYIWNPREANLPATSAPYFDSRCGVKVTNFGDLSAMIDLMESTHYLFDPKTYVKENLSFEASTKRLLEVFDTHWPFADEESGIDKPLSWVWWWPVVAVELRIRSRWRRWIYRLLNGFYK